MPLPVDRWYERRLPFPAILAGGFTTRSILRRRHRYPGDEYRSKRLFDPAPAAAARCRPGQERMRLIVDVSQRNPGCVHDQLDRERGSSVVAIQGRRRCLCHKAHAGLRRTAVLPSSNRGEHTRRYVEEASKRWNACRSGIRVRIEQCFAPLKNWTILRTVSISLGAAWRSRPNIPARRQFRNGQKLRSNDDSVAEYQRPPTSARR